MNVLWIINNPTEDISKYMDFDVKDNMGWLTGYLNEIKKNINFNLSIAYPYKSKQILITKIEGVKYFSFYKQSTLLNKGTSLNEITKTTILHLTNIINSEKPDIMHIYGSEYEHSLIAAKIFKKPSYTLIHIQGIISVIAQYYDAGLSTKVLRKFAVSNIFRGSIYYQKKAFIKRGKNEIELLKYISNVNGRTEWDEACVKRINPYVNYFFCNESLRGSFYKYRWDYGVCEKHIIFMSQGNYPIKGVHFAIEALSDVVKEFPKAHLYIAGNDLTNTKGIYNRLKISSYGLYIKKLINKLGLNENITFTGFLNEEEMINFYLKANVYISASSIENSSNSICEAMLLGMPVIASDVGGIKNFISHGINGLLYQYDAPYMLGYYINKIFYNENFTKMISINARKQAIKTHDRLNNYSKLNEIYNNLLNNNTQEVR